MKLTIESLSIFRITSRRARELVEKIVGQGLTFGSGKRPLRGFRVIEIKKPGGSDYFVGLKLDELEFKEITFAPESDLQNP